jgi:kinesin family protein 4/21/27
MHKLLALNQKQKMVSFLFFFLMLPSNLLVMPACSMKVLQRKTEEAAMAAKRLKDLLETKKSTRDTYGKK